MMWEAGDRAEAAEKGFWLHTVREAPALFGAEAISVHYDLEAFVLFARSALDVAATVFGYMLPSPFERKRFDSFNRMLKDIERFGPADLQSYFDPLRKSVSSWVSVLSGLERGHSLRDKISHQTEFPLQYAELSAASEKEYAIVVLDDETAVALPQFIDSVRSGTLEGFRQLEDACMSGVDVTP
jgi:hypothetical protein